MLPFFNNKFLSVILICLSLLVVYFLIHQNFFSNSPTSSIDVKNTLSQSDVLSIENCGDSLGSFNDVTAYYNAGGINSCGNRHWSSDSSYYYGFKWQCVEYIRRYYYDYLNHIMPERWGNASDYFRANIPSGSMNIERDLVQYHNGDIRPQVNDLLVFQHMAGGLGHVSIVTNVSDSTVSTIEQNIGRGCANVLSLDGNQIGGGCSGLLRIAN